MNHSEARTGIRAFPFLVPYHQPLEVSKMKSLTSLILVLTVLLTCAPLRAEPVIHSSKYGERLQRLRKLTSISDGQMDSYSRVGPVP